ncbi:MAG: peroxiredoxin-like family protein [Gammaproteobacteria bacterium]|nr:peroxiredoxin-like family protein [Gammaproteobacteria bacterium]
MTVNCFSERLAEMNRENCNQLPTPQVAILLKATAMLRRSGILEKCLHVGESVPDFVITGCSNDASTLFKLLREGPVVINFFRGLWCAYCKTELLAYEQVLEEIEALGARYLAVSPHQNIQPDEFCDTYQVVCDCDNQIAKSFGIVYELGPDEKKLLTEWDLSLTEVNQSEKWELPLPATYIVNPDRRIGFQFVDADFRMRLPPDEIVNFLRHST